MLNKYGFIALVIALSMAFTDYAQSAERRVIVEDHTGAWCQFCPDGSVTLRELLAEFGDSFIPVQIHNGDRMENPDQQTLAQAIGLQGYPGGTVDRAFRGQGTNAATWDPRTRERIGKYVPLDVAVEYSINGTTLEAVVTVTADEAINEQFAVNLIVLEDGVTGNGTGWDQVNAFNNQQGHPYYQKGNPVTNYIHDNVAWKYVEGLWGTTSGVPATMAAGESFTKTITWNLSEESRIQNPDNIWVAALAQEMNQGEFINAAMAGKKGVEETSPLTVSVTGLGEQYILNSAGTAISESFEVENTSDVQLDVSLSTESSILPPNWTATPSAQMLSIAPGAKETVIVNVMDNSGAAGYAVVTLDVEITNDLNDGQFKTEGTGSFHLLNDNTKNLFLYGLSDDPNSQLQGLSTTTEFFTDIAVIPLTEDILENFDLSFVETAYLEVNDDNAPAFSSAAFDSYRTAIKGMVDGGVDVFISGGLNMLAAVNDEFGGVASQNAKSFYDYLGLEYSGALGLVSNGQLSTVGVTGQGPLAGLTAIINGSFNQQTQIYDQAVDFASVKDGNDVTMLGAIQGLQMGGTPVPNEDAIVIAGVQKENARIAVATFSFETIGTVAQRQAMMDAVYDWLKSDGSGGGSPLISVANTLDFGFVQGPTTEEIVVENKGTAALMLSKIQITNDENGEYAFDNSTYPSQGIEPGASATLKVTYLASMNGTSTADLVITSSDGENDATIKMSGSTEVQSVTNEINNVLSMEAIPNTFETETNLHVNVVGTTTANINLVDINGNQVSNLFNGTITGTPTINVNASKLASGKYFIIANVDGKIARVPVIVE